MKTLDEISEEISEKQKQLKEFQTSQYIVEDEILKLQKKIIELAARNCPVALSLHPDLKQGITFNFNS